MLTVTESFAGPRDYLISGRYFKLLAAGLPVDISFASKGSPTDSSLAVITGFRYAQQFDRLRVVANAGGDTIKFVVSDGEAGYDQQTNVVIVKPSQFKSVPDVVVASGVATQILAADGTRQQAMITIPAGAGANVRIGDANIGAARGVLVAAGLVVTIPGSAPIFLFQASGGPVNVPISTVND